MLRLILGRSGTGKTKYIRDLLADLAQNGHGGLILIVPEQFSFESERALFEILGAKSFDKLEVLSFTRLADSIFRSYGGLSGRRLDDSGRGLMLAQAMDKARDNLKIYGDKNKNSKLIKGISELIREFKNSRVNSDDLAQASNMLPDGILKAKTKDLSAILGTYDALVGQSFADPDDDLTLAVELAEGEDFFKGRTVAIDAFKSFTRQELRLIEIILRDARDVFVTLCADSLNDQDMGLGLFSPAKKTAKALIDMARKIGVETAAPLKLGINHRAMKNRELLELESALFQPGSNAFYEPCENIGICSAADIYEECDLAAAIIKKLVREENIRCRDIIVTMESAERYQGTIENALKKQGLPVFFDERQPVSAQPLPSLILSAIEVINSNFASASVLSYLKSGLTGLDEMEIFELENYAVYWKLSGKGWLKEQRGSPRGLGVELTDEDVAALEKINASREKLIAPLSKLKRDCEGGTARIIAGGIYRFLTSIDAPASLRKLAVDLEAMGEPALSEEQSRVWDMMMNILDQTVWALGDTPMNLKTYGELFELSVSLQDMGSIPNGLDEIQIGSAVRMRAENPKVVYALGANEGIFPPNPPENPILNEGDRRKLSALGLDISDTFEEIAVESRLSAYQALCSASKKVFVSYARQSPSGAASSPSIIVSQIEKTFPNCMKISADSLDYSDMAQSEITAFERLASGWNEGNEFNASLRKLFEETSGYRDRLEAMERMANKPRIKLKDKKLSAKLFGERARVSASGVEQYYKCGFAYFCKYGLRARPREKAELDSRRSGSAIHYILEKLIREYKSSLAQASPEERAGRIEFYLSEYLEKYMGGEEDKSERFKNRYARLKKTVGRLADHMAKEFAVSSFQPESLEHKIDWDADEKPLEIILPDGRQAYVVGVIDRVDVMNKNGVKYVRVVDYKSGGKAFNLSDIMSGLNLQMMIYLAILYKNSGEEIIPAGIMYQSSKAAEPSLPRRASQEEIELEKSKLYKMNGLALEDPVALDGMEKGGKGIFIPAYINKKGEMKGSLASLEQMGMLMRKAERLISQMEESLYDGDIQATPLKGGNMDSCAFCEFRAVCAREDSDEFKRMSADSSKEIFDRLEEEENGGAKLD